MGRFRIARVKIDVCDVGLKMAFRNFIYTEDDEDLSFLPKELSPGFGIGSSSVSVNMEPLKADEKLVIQPIEVTADSRESPKLELFVVHSGSVAARIKDIKLSDDDEELLDIHDRCYMRQLLLYNDINRRSRMLLRVIVEATRCMIEFEKKPHCSGPPRRR
ncbi:hypothetical protein Tco_0332931 [Tanacetum coccineum]